MFYKICYRNLCTRVWDCEKVTQWSFRKDILIFHLNTVKDPVRITPWWPFLLNWFQICRGLKMKFVAPMPEQITLFFKRNAAFLNPFFTATLGHWPWPQVMYILSNGSGSNLQKTLLRYSSRVSRNPSLFEYMSFWAHDKTAQIPLQSMQTWYFFQMMHFVWSRVYGIESLGILYNPAVVHV